MNLLQRNNSNIEWIVCARRNTSENVYRLLSQQWSNKRARTKETAEEEWATNIGWTRREQQPTKKTILYFSLKQFVRV